MKPFSVKKITTLAALTAAAVAVHIAEGALLAPLPIPGVKLGLANAVTLLVLYVLGAREAVAVALLRVLLTSLVGGRFLSVAFYMSLSGTVSATALMVLLRFVAKPLSPVGVSVCGAAAHNAAQLCTACLIAGQWGLLYYAAPLLVSACVTGILTGLCVRSLIRPLNAALTRR